MKPPLSLLVCALALAACATGAWAQAPAAYDLSGSVSYMHLPAVDSRPPSTAAVGWNAALDTNVAHPFGAELQLSGFYKSNLICNQCTTTSIFPAYPAAAGYTLVAGPRWQWARSPSAPAAFLHALFGADFIVAPGADGTVASLASVLGGGVDVPLARSWSLRLAADYLIIRTPVEVMIPSGNIRLSAGLVFRFGGR